ncbi:MAG: 3-phosphoshikimate 1-carboxyvinyltransferase [Tannerellaceae bacterium]|jgi:3-phosphoshikimate 1-carboxyvinyltransferase|nr:3-phosphoshikimate 1-carboxyvinyltransferase [Tannerellaceae bacterium]
MEYVITGPGQPVRLSVALPASKSISNRILILNALSGNFYETENLSDSDDTRVMIEALNSGGADFNIKAAGTAMRFLTAFLANCEGEWTITGTERMRNRPIQPLVDALTALGARIEYIEKRGFPPLRIFGRPLPGGEVSLPGNISSQYISALLMIAPTMKNGLAIRLEGEVISAPYIHLTVGLMEQYGVKVDWKGDALNIPHQAYRPIPFRVESDWSAASYWYTVAALSEGAEIELPGLSKSSMQGDSMVAKLFSQLGVTTTHTPSGVKLSRTGRRCKRFVYNFVDVPDLAQTLAVACALLGVPFLFSGLQSLRIKETDRVDALMRELRKLGYVLKNSRNHTLKWSGERCEPAEGHAIATYEDHRMAMAFAPAALAGAVTIADPSVVTKSYPRFWKEMERAGFTIKLHVPL